MNNNSGFIITIDKKNDIFFIYEYIHICYKEI